MRPPSFRSRWFFFALFFFFTFWFYLLLTWTTFERPKWNCPEPIDGREENQSENERIKTMEERSWKDKRSFVEPKKQRSKLSDGIIAIEMCFLLSLVFVPIFIWQRLCECVWSFSLTKCLCMSSVECVQIISGQKCLVNLNGFAWIVNVWRIYTIFSFDTTKHKQTPRQNTGFFANCMQRRFSCITSKWMWRPASAKNRLNYKLKTAMKSNRNFVDIFIHFLLCLFVLMCGRWKCFSVAHFKHFCQLVHFSPFENCFLSQNKRLIVDQWKRTKVNGRMCQSHFEPLKNVIE